MRRTATLFVVMALSSSSVDAMAFSVPRRANASTAHNAPSVNPSSSAVDGVVARTALYARPSRQSSSGAYLLSEEGGATGNSTPMPTRRVTKIDTSGFGRDDSLDSYKAEILNLVYHRSMQRAGLE